ncbi:hypothetical protein PFCIP103579_2685 [Prolinoborus fasciculus]|nr:hypothetical protein [Prolinoborus fasciculus]SPJ21541.1 hypothetical protein PFCIP103579_2685 [Prolinoborus fasciculus]
MENPEKIEIEGLKTIHKLCKFGADHNMEGCTFTEIVERMFSKIEQMKTQVNTLDEMLLNQGEALAQAKAQAVPEGFVLINKSDRNQEMLELIDQRDYMESQAEELKDKLQALYGVDFGEHSNCNFPFQNAIDYDDSDLVLVPKEPTLEALKAISAEIIKPNNGRIFLAKVYKAMIEAQEPAND